MSGLVLQWLQYLAHHERVAFVQTSSEGSLVWLASPNPFDGLHNAPVLLFYPIKDGLYPDKRLRMPACCPDCSLDGRHRLLQYLHQGGDAA